MAARSPQFRQMLIDLNDVVKPKLQTMDAIIESDGQFARDPRKIALYLLRATTVRPCRNLLASFRLSQVCTTVDAAI